MSRSSGIPGIGVRRFIVTFTLVITGSVGGLALAPMAHATGAVAANDSFVTMVSDGDYVGAGADYIFTPTLGDSVSVSGTLVGNIDVAVSGDGNHEFALDLAAPDGTSLADGAYPNAQRTSFRTAGHAGLDIYGDGRGCDTVDGQFNVLDVGTAQDGTIDRLDLTYVEYCEGDEATPLFGQISFNEPQQDPDLMIAPTAISWPDTFDGTSARIAPVRLINTGAAPAAIASLGSTGDASVFPIRSDACSGKTLPVGGACAANIGFTPSSAVGSAARLTATDGTTFGHQDVSLAGTGIGGYTSWSQASDPGDWVGKAKTHAWTPATATITASGDDTGLTASVVAGSDNYTARFEPGDSDVIVAGTTYDATRADVGGAGPTMDVSGDGAGCDTIAGQFTVQQADFDPISGALLDFALTFVQHCEGGAPALYGSIAYKAPDPPAAVPPSTYTPPPTTPPPTTPPAPRKPGRITALVGRGLSSGIALTWHNPTSSLWSRSEVRIRPGDNAPTGLRSGYFVDQGSVPATVIDGLNPGGDYSVSVFPLTSSGVAGHADSFTMHGSDLALSAPTHATDHRTTVAVTLRAAASRAPLGRRQVALYARRHDHRGGYRLIATLTTKAGTGRATITLRTSVSLDLIARFNGASSYIGSAAGPRPVLTQ
jgi:hypothetical protein